MESRLSVRGNAVQPLLLMFPLGLLAVVVILDVARLLGAPTMIGTLAYCTQAAGLVGGAATAVAVGIDRVTAPRDRTAKPQPLRHLLDPAVLVVFAVLLLIRMRTPDRTAGPGLVALELVGLALAASATWFGIRDTSEGRSS
ncbi:DUF2231 domain-containing protein [Actinoplanes sp. NPDC049548]|uniref:DUF2231 domain-containing protein n=1 Tax=Actinoplanes sp. NPDC049548 TaxID=3155152 RepID=UPI0034315FCE